MLFTFRIGLSVIHSACYDCLIDLKVSMLISVTVGYNLNSVATLKSVPILMYILNIMIFFAFFRKIFGAFPCLALGAQITPLPLIFDFF